MEARQKLTHVYLWLLIGLLLSVSCHSNIQAQFLRRPAGPASSVAVLGKTEATRSPRYRFETPHFIVNAPDPVLARKIGNEAERFRKELAIEWLGHELSEWQDKCPIHVELSMHSGGETSFAFVTNARNESHPRSWQMTICGTPERLLDSVLPHEVTHTIFATHFGRPLPRWADEGACTIVEHESERAKNHQMLINFLQTNRGIPFNRMYEMKNYPHDILPLYAQGHSLSKFLVMQKGRRHFLDYIDAGMKAEDRGPLLAGWNQVTEKFYGYRDLSSLQEAWIAWVRKGSPETQVAAKSGNTRNEPQSTTPTAPQAKGTFASAPRAENQEKFSGRAELPNPKFKPKSGSLSSKAGLPTEFESRSWYVSQSRNNHRASTQKRSVNRPADPSTESLQEESRSNGKMTFQTLETLKAEMQNREREQESMFLERETIWR